MSTPLFATNFGRKALVAAWLVLAAWPAAGWQQQPAQTRFPSDRPDPLDTKLPSGKSQRDEILKADHEKNLEEVRELAKLSTELRDELEKTDKHVLSMGSIKKTEEIEKLAKRIRGRLKRY